MSFVSICIFSLDFVYFPVLRSRIGFHQPSDCMLEDDRQILLEVAVGIRITAEIVMEIDHISAPLTGINVIVFRIDICS